MKRYLFCLTTHIAGIVLLTACALLAFVVLQHYRRSADGGYKLQPLSHSDAADFHDTAYRGMHETERFQPDCLPVFQRPGYAGTGQ